MLFALLCTGMHVAAEARVYVRVVVHIQKHHRVGCEGFVNEGTRRWQLIVHVCWSLRSATPYKDCSCMNVHIYKQHLYATTLRAYIVHSSACQFRVPFYQRVYCAPTVPDLNLVHVQ